MKMRKIKKSAIDQASVVLVIKILIVGFVLMFVVTTGVMSWSDLKEPSRTLLINYNTNQSIRNRHQEVFEEYSKKHVLVKASSTAIACSSDNMQILSGEVLSENRKFDMILLLTDVKTPQYYSLCLGDDSHQHSIELTLDNGQCDIIVSVTTTSLECCHIYS